MKQFTILIIIMFLQTTLIAENKISYIHKDITLDSITNKEINWEELKAPIYRGFDNGVYWFKMELEPAATDRIISIPESHISRANLYLNGNEVSKIEPNRFVSFRIKADTMTQHYYLKVNCLLEARIPIQINAVEKYQSNQTTDYIAIALYYGIVFTILLFNIFSYINLKRKIYLHYIVVCFGMTMTPFYKDGTSALIFGLTGVNEVIEVFLSGIVVIGGFYFTASYFRMNEDMPRAWKTTIYIIILAYFSSVMFLITRSLFFFASAHILLIIALDIFIISAFLLWKKNLYARFFALAYILPLFAAHEYFISPYFALPSADIPLFVFKIGSIIEMIIFSFAITVQTKKLIQDNDQMRVQLIEYTQQLKRLDKDLIEKPDTMTELVENFGLTLKEIEILKVLSLNKTNKEIAELQFISENTVKFHIKNLCKKLGVHTKKDAKNHYLSVNSDGIEKSIMH